MRWFKKLRDKELNKEIEKYKRSYNQTGEVPPELKQGMFPEKGDISNVPGAFYRFRRP